MIIAFPVGIDGDAHSGERMVFDEMAARRRCESAIAALDLSPPYAVGDMVRSASLLIRRRIELIEFRGPVGLTALLVDNGRAIGLGVACDLVGLLRRHVVAHELGHLLLGHPLHPISAGCHVQLDGDPDGQVSQAEAEAELFATLLLSRAEPAFPLMRVIPRPRRRTGRHGDWRNRVDRAFPPTLRGRRL